MFCRKGRPSGQIFFCLDDKLSVQQALQDRQVSLLWKKKTF
jgi:hypothetical protein